MSAMMPRWIEPGAVSPVGLSMFTPVVTPYSGMIDEVEAAEVQADLTAVESAEAAAVVEEGAGS